MSLNFNCSGLNSKQHEKIQIHGTGACVRACVRACARVRACVRTCVCVCVRRVNMALFHSDPFII